MSKELEALQKLRDLVEYLTRIDYVPTELRNDVKELLIKSYEDSNGYFSQIEEAIKRNEPMKVGIQVYTNGFFKNWRCENCHNSIEEKYANYCPDCGQKLDWKE